MAVLNWKHHTLIQALMARGPLTEPEFRSIFADVNENNGASARDFSNFLLKINKELSYVQMELRCCRDQHDGRVNYGLVNTVSDEQSKLGTTYSVPRIALFKGVVEAILHDATASGCISTIDALNIKLENQTGRESQSQAVLSEVPPAIRNFSMWQKEKTLDELVQDKWLFHTSNGGIALGVKSYLDLRSWFHGSGMSSCEVCNEAAVKAKVCPSEGCTMRIHHYCLRKKISQSRVVVLMQLPSLHQSSKDFASLHKHANMKIFQGEIVCPSCGIQWECQVPKTEAIEEVSALDVAKGNQPRSGSGRKRLRVNRNLHVETKSCGSEDPQSLSGVRRVTRASTRTR